MGQVTFITYFYESRCAQLSWEMSYKQYLMYTISYLDLQIYSTLCTVLNMSHLFLPAISWFNQKKKNKEKKNHFKYLCREIGHAGGGGLRSPTVDRDQQQQETTIHTDAQKQSRERRQVSEAQGVNSSGRSWNHSKPDQQEPEPWRGRSCCQQSPWGQRSGREIFWLLPFLSLFSKHSLPLISSRQKASSQVIRLEHGATQRKSEDTEAQALHILQMPHSQASLLLFLYSPHRTMQPTSPNTSSIFNKINIS